MDTGWINDENPLDKAHGIAERHDFQTPLDEIDAAARVVDPILQGVKDGQAAAAGGGGGGGGGEGEGEGEGEGSGGLVTLEQYFKIGGPWEGKFSRWDEHGVPTHTADGEPVTKSMAKKVDKARNKHKAKWTKRADDPDPDPDTAESFAEPAPPGADSAARAAEAAPKTRRKEPVWGKFLKDFVETEW